MTPPPIADEVLVERDVVRRIPGRDAVVRAWLRGLGIARRGPTGIVYRWSDVLAALPLLTEPVAVVPIDGGATLRRSSRVR